MAHQRHRADGIAPVPMALAIGHPHPPPQKGEEHTKTTQTDTTIMKKALRTTALRYMLLLLPLLLPAGGMAQQYASHTLADTLRAHFLQMLMPETATSDAAEQR